MSSSTEPSTATKVSEPAPIASEEKPKPCCACPETKQARDACMLQSSNGPIECAKLIEAHKKCMAQYGYEV
ncbi:Cytochrome c oxidase copper chaperone [Schizosaccharomyces pombe]|uniref:Cytochrome c oxidase copper chaperone n=1 Tax=Schizosaccharomyces pombe (strain 972 / ATCC 24843) TaxID=284812 RepID=COX17_SCHPO|nr:putative cytochrome C oxidase copper chaperone Cox17 [Schizosaccharomyces pombe]Q9P7Z7.1 RecName: Full=Cytochrome c oxidase copper chaperone [Schizosaccharomyces pombe 972h-]CAB75401.1 cytochrome C oxidase copper chaperone Cox17 (predicted) [Schizosaccharomyces pombe]|eukprot:NP_596649.1 putative cytochrome C oxidase copper chaperone Cox17 [Schizosaccharomyces pombe]